jgi:hypothetical protein
MLYLGKALVLENMILVVKKSAYMLRVQKADLDEAVNDL